LLELLVVVEHSRMMYVRPKSWKICCTLSACDARGGVLVSPATLAAARRRLVSAGLPLVLTRTPDSMCTCWFLTGGLFAWSRFGLFVLRGESNGSSGYETLCLNAKTGQQMGDIIEIPKVAADQASNSLYQNAAGWRYPLVVMLS